MDKRKELMYDLEKTMQYTFRGIRKGINEMLGDEVNSSEFLILKHLYQNGTQKVSTISNELRVTSSHITSIGDSLVKKLLVTRERSLEDRRVVEIVLTKKGNTLIEELNLKKTNYLFSTFDNLSDLELKELIHLFNKFNL
ncbi:MarR family winged helix-turn-helix transcriptional regulator [Bacillus sp. DJP31]|uniref:MarR family winged helix-turn-helix transcriptional regulator n=1 Tax=Bacillus sp. DJP31 TaxID=3409789 RepID=UPI003BB7CCF8